MLEVVEAIYTNGAFVPEKTFDLPEGARIKIVVETLPSKIQNGNAAVDSSHVQEPTITDPEERKAVLAKLRESMRSNPIPPEAPRKFTREELYERR